MTFNWSQIYSLKDAVQHLYNNEFLSDVKFQFPDGRTIFAHSFVLCLRSEEFYNNFQDTIGVTKLIPVHHFTYDGFRLFFKYLYAGYIEINESNVSELLTLAIKYQIIDLIMKCQMIAINQMNEENVCQFLELSVKENSNLLEKSCKEFISQNYFKTLNTNSFLEIDENILKMILNYDPVSNVSEMEIFESLLKWINNSCKKDGIPLNSSTQRAKMGDKIKLIRFASMTTEEFAKSLKLTPNLLSNDEIAAVYTNIATKETNAMGFSDKKRIKIKPFVDIKEFDYKDSVEVPYARRELIQYRKGESDKCVMYFHTTKPCIINGLFLFIYGLKSLVIDIKECGVVKQRELCVFVPMGPENYSYTPLTPFPLKKYAGYSIEYEIVNNSKDVVLKGYINDNCHEKEGFCDEIVFLYNQMHTHVTDIGIDPISGSDTDSD